MNFEIRQAVPADAAILADLGAEVFYHAFTDFSTPDDMQQYLADTFTEEKLRAEFEEPSMVYYIAYVDEQPAAFAKLTRKRTPEALYNVPCIELERLYVHPDLQNRKIGHGLMQQCINTAREQGNEVIWLGVSENNPGAIRLYERRGFKKFGEHIFQLGTDPQTDWLMRLDL